MHIHIGKAVSGHGTNVRACSEGFFATCDDHAADSGVVIKLFERSAQLSHELLVECIQLLGAVQSNHTNFVSIDSGLDHFVGHENSLEVELKESHQGT